MKQVQITLRLSSEFVGLLRAKCELAKFHDRAVGEERFTNPLDPAGLLALVVCAEARGGYEDDTRNLIRRPWKLDDINIVPEERKVFEDGKQIAGIKQTPPAAGTGREGAK